MDTSRSTPEGHRPETPSLDAFVEGIDYPMLVVTAAAGDRRAGCLVGFATQASIDPSRLLVCLSVANHTYAVARETGLLGVHLLAEGQHDLASLFGSETGDDVDKLSRCRWRAGPGGVPLLDDCARSMVGRVLSRTPLGDHVGFLLEPLEVTTTGRAPGITFRDVTDVEPGHPA